LLLGSASAAEAARIGFDQDDQGMVIWDGARDVGSMNAPVKQTFTGNLGIGNADQLIVDFSLGVSSDPNLPQGDGVVTPLRAYLLITGPVQAGQKTLFEALCPNSDPSLGNCPDLDEALQNVDLSNTTDNDPNNDSNDDYVRNVRLVAFSALLAGPVPTGPSTAATFTLVNPNDKSAFNAALALIGPNNLYHFALVGYVAGRDNNEQTLFAVRNLAVPEPASIMLFGVAALGALRRRIRF